MWKFGVYTVYMKVKVKFTLEKALKVQRGIEVKLYSSLTSALDGSGWLTPHRVHLTPGKETRYPLCRRLDGPQGRSGRVQKKSPSPEFDPQTVQSVASRYTD
jgi:hypothetical protein